MEKEYGMNLKNKELINAPLKSDLGKKYFSAMNGAINFAFCNRQIIMDKVRKVLEKNFPKAKMNLLYDVCHNIAKIEEHKIEGKKRDICIHRKGATRAFGPGRIEIPKIYRETGQPVIIPGSMGTSSYILVGTNKSEEISYGSTAHGAGRVLSRSSANKNLDLPKLEKEMKKKEILILTDNRKGLLEEAPEAYKDVEEVVNISDSLGIAKKVAKLKPVMVIKG
jgi:tRNA-splicing ligase RtcB